MFTKKEKLQGKHLPPMHCKMSSLTVLFHTSLTLWVCNDSMLNWLKRADTTHDFQGWRQDKLPNVKIGAATQIRKKVEQLLNSWKYANPKFSARQTRRMGLAFYWRNLEVFCFISENIEIWGWNWNEMCFFKLKNLPSFRAKTSKWAGLLIAVWDCIYLLETENIPHGGPPSLTGAMASRPHLAGFTPNNFPRSWWHGVSSCAERS